MKLLFTRDQVDGLRTTAPVTGIRNLAKDWLAMHAELERLRELEGSDEHPEDRCERCKGRNLHCWYADNDVWNRFAGDYSVLCPICLSELASEAGLAPTAWRLAIEGDDPEVSKLKAALHARLKESAQLHAEVKRLQALVNKLPTEGIGLRVQITKGVTVVEKVFHGRTATVTRVVNYHGKISFWLLMDTPLPEWAIGNAEQPRHLLVEAEQVEAEAAVAAREAAEKEG